MHVPLRMRKLLCRANPHGGFPPHREVAAGIHVDVDLDLAGVCIALPEITDYRCLSSERNRRDMACVF